MQLELFDKRFDKVYSLVKDLHSLSNTGTLSKRGSSLRAARPAGIDRMNSSVAEEETLEREIAQMEEEADRASDDDESDEEQFTIGGAAPGMSSISEAGDGDLEMKVAEAEAEPVTR